MITDIIEWNLGPTDNLKPYFWLGPCGFNVRLEEVVVHVCMMRTCGLGNYDPNHRN